MKNKVIVTIIIILSIILIITGTILIKNNNHTYHDAKYIDITYQEEHDEYACITFDKNGKYSMYDCDSEPTNYFFDDENECTYSYDGKNVIYFDCKYKEKYNKIKVIEWTKDTFKFEYENKIKNFYAD